MSLREMQATGDAVKKPVENNQFGLVLRVATAEDDNGTLKLTGTTLTNNSRLPAGSEVVIGFRNDSGGKSLSNFIKGNGKQALKSPDATAGTFVTLEGCYLTGEKDGERSVISSRWVNTLAAAGDSDHANRSFVENVYATAPRLSFDVPNLQPGEPKRVTLPTNAQSVRARVLVDGKPVEREFSREWAIEKLGALAPKTKVAVTIDTLDPSDALVVESKQALDAALRDQLARGTKAMAMIRVFDGEDVLSRLIYVPFKKEGDVYLPDVDKAMEDLYAQNIIRRIPNETLFQAIEEGKLVAECVPGYRMTYAGDTTRDNNAAYKLVSDMKSGREAKHAEAIFGKDPNRFSKVILSGIARNESVDGFSPINVITDEPGTYAPAELVTACIRPRPMQEGAVEDQQDEAEAPRP